MEKRKFKKKKNGELDLKGEKFERLTVLERAEKPKNVTNRQTYWLCECVCGNRVTVLGTSLTAGNSKSCGCLRRETQSELNKTHGLSKTRFYNIWASMKKRCYDIKHNEYNNYGAKGIKVSDEWLTFENFKNDMYESYIKFEEIHGKNTASIDRTDSDKNYCKENCTWQTQLEQARNRKNNIPVEVNGKTYRTISELAEEYGLNYLTVLNRYKAGKRGEDLIAPPKVKTDNVNRNPRSIQVEVNGVTYESLSALRRAYPYISSGGLSKRYKKGLRGEELIKPPIQ